MNQPKENTTEKKWNNLVKGTHSINLIPPLTQAEAVVVESKVKVNVGAAISMLILFVLTLIIVGFNIFSKLDLNKKKNDLYKLENQVSLRENVISSNDEILRRITLYKRIQASTYSVKQIVEYFQNTSAGIATIDSVEITGGSAFVVTGSAPSLNEVSKLWYILGNDGYIENVNLKNVSRDSTSAKFHFEGKLKLTQFTNGGQQSS